MKIAHVFAAAMVTLAAVSIASPATAASFNCTVAKTLVEKTICADPVLGRLDERISARYKTLLAAMDPASAAALREDQNWFLSSRDEAVAQVAGRSERTSELKRQLDARAALLDAIVARPVENQPYGTWRNAAGKVTVTPSIDGSIVLVVSAAEPANARWACDVEGQGNREEDSFRIASPDVVGWSIILRREGAALFVKERQDNGEEAGSPYCGMNGSVSGHYFLTRPWKIDTQASAQQSAPPVSNPALVQQHELGRDAYTVGDYPKAFAAFNTACSAGYGRSCFNVGLMAEQGQGMKADLAIAMEQYEASCGRDFGRGCTAYAQILRKRDRAVRDDSLVARYLSMGCDKGDAGGCNSLAEATYTGEGVAADAKSAALLFRRACEEGGPAQACFNYGLMLAKGEGVAADQTEALSYYRRACDAGNNAGCINLGYAYSHAEGVEKDDVMAVLFFKRACTADPRACINFGYMAETGAGVPVDRQKAITTYKKACDDGAGAACHRLGMLYAENRKRNSGRDRGKARTLVERGCTLEDGQSCYAAGLLHWTGFGVKKSAATALGWYARSCDLGYAAGCAGAALPALDLNDALRGGLPAARRWVDQGKRLDSQNDVVKAADAWLARIEMEVEL